MNMKPLPPVLFDPEKWSWDTEPCKGCPNRATCASKLLQCDSFKHWQLTGKNDSSLKIDPFYSFETGRQVAGFVA